VRFVDFRKFKSIPAMFGKFVSFFLLYLRISETVGGSPIFQRKGGGVLNSGPSPTMTIGMLVFMSLNFGAAWNWEPALPGSASDVKILPGYIAGPINQSPIFWS
jgi:hypothetical protein